MSLSWRVSGPEGSDVDPVAAVALVSATLLSGRRDEAFH
jgi:hypothetical protein